VLETLCRCDQVSQMCSSTDLKPTPKSQTSVKLLGFKILRHWLQFSTNRDLGFGALGFEALGFEALRVELLQELRAGRIDGSDWVSMSEGDPVESRVSKIQIVLDLRKLSAFWI
jgi:hypothetical protein